MFLDSTYIKGLRVPRGYRNLVGTPRAPAGDRLFPQGLLGSLGRARQSTSHTYLEGL